MFAIISKIRLGVLSLKYVWECCPFLIELLAQPLPSGDIPVTEIADPESGEFLQSVLDGARGQAELAITGGSEAPFSFGFLKAWEAMRVVAPDTCLAV